MTEVKTASGDINQVTKKPKATRDAYGEALLELGKKRPDIVALDADLSGSTKTCLPTPVAISQPTKKPRKSEAANFYQSYKN